MTPVADPKLYKHKHIKGVRSLGLSRGDVEIVSSEFRSGPVWYENLYSVVICPAKSRHKNLWSG